MVRHCLVAGFGSVSPGFGWYAAAAGAKQAECLCGGHLIVSLKLPREHVYYLWGLLLLVVVLLSYSCTLRTSPRCCCPALRLWLNWWAMRLCHCHNR